MNYAAMALFEELKKGLTTKDRLNKRAYRIRHKDVVTEDDYDKLAAINEAQERYNVWLRQDQPIQQDVWWYHKCCLIQSYNSSYYSIDNNIEYKIDLKEREDTWQNVFDQTPYPVLKIFLFIIINIDLLYVTKRTPWVVLLCLYLTICVVIKR